VYSLPPGAEVIVDRLLGQYSACPLAQQLELGGIEVEDGHFDPFVACVALFLESRTRVNEAVRLPHQK
jgi:hypothetical protein